MEKTVTIRFKASQELIDNLVTAWVEDEGITIVTGGGTDNVDLAWVKESN